MIKQVFRDSIIYSIAGLVTGGAVFLALPIYSRFLGAEAYGVFELINLSGMMLGGVLTLEIRQGLGRYIPERRDNQDSVKIYASTALWFTVAMYFIGTGAVGLLRGPISVYFVGNVQYAGVVFAAAVGFMITAVNTLMTGQLQWALQSRRSAILSVAVAAAVTGCSIILVWGFNAGIIGTFGGSVIGGLLVIPFGLWLTRGSFGFYFSLTALRRMAGYSGPLVLSSLGWYLSNYTDRLVIKDLLTLEDLGIYSMGFRVAGIIVLLITGLESALNPLIYAQAKDSATPGRIAEMLRVVTAVAVIMCGGLVCFSPELLFVFATPAFRDAILVVPFLSLSILLSRFYIFAPGLGLAKKTGIVALLNIAGGFLNIGLNYMMIPFWGIVGAAAATLLSTALIFVLIMYFSQRYYPVPHHFLPLFLLTSTSMVLMLCTAFGYQMYHLEFLVRVLVFAILLGLPFMCRVVKKEEFKLIFRQLKKLDK